MPKPLIGSEYFKVNTEANLLHEQGLSHGISGNHDVADYSFTSALNVILSSDVEQLSPLDKQVQISRIIRDKGFNLVRRSLRDVNVNLYSDGFKYLDESDIGFYQGEARLTEISDQLSVETKKILYQAVSAERGATLSLLGRAVTSREVVLDIKNGQNEANRYYNRAHGNLVYGNNGYYRVSNAINAARHEKINGKNVAMLGWMGKAIVGLGFSVVKDRKNFKKALLTFGSRTLDLTSKDKAKKSVKVKP